MTVQTWTRSRFVSVVIGMFAGGIAVLLLESAGHALLGTADPGDLSSVTPAMFASVLVAWIVGSAVAGAVATLWSRSDSVVPGVIVGLLLLAAAGANMLVIPHPTWMVVAAVLLMPATALLAAKRFVRAAAA